MRQITITGHIVADAEIKVGKNGGSSFLTMRIANNEYNDPENCTYWFRVTSFLPRHVNLAKYYTKGKPIIVVGNYSDGIYQSQQTGKCSVNRDIVASEIYFQTEGNNRNNDNNSNGQQSRSSAAQSATTNAPLRNPSVEPITSVNNTAPTVTSNDSDDLPF